MGSSPISATNGPLVKRLRHRPFTAVTGVRFSHGSPKRKPRQTAWLFVFIPYLAHESREQKYSPKAKISTVDQISKRSHGKFRDSFYLFVQIINIYNVCLTLKINGYFPIIILCNSRKRIPRLDGKQQRGKLKILNVIDCSRNSHCLV